MITKDKKRYIYLAVLILLVVLSYIRTLNYGFILDWDDNWLVNENKVVQSVTIKNVVTIANPFASRENLGAEYLPIRDYSYMLDFGLHGGSPAGFHISSLIYYLIGIIVFFIVARKLLKSDFWGFVTACVFGLHPIHIESVTWISSRKDVLAMLFVFLGLYAFIKYYTEGKKINLILIILFYILAVLSKYTAIIMPFLLIALDIFIMKNGSDESKINRKLLYSILIAICALLLVNSIFVGYKHRVIRGEFYGGSRLETIMAMPIVLCEYLKMLFFPVNLQIPRDFNQYLADGILNVRFIISSLIVISLSVILIINILKLIRKKDISLRYAPAIFLITWFFISLAPVSNIIIPIQELIAERYLSIPSIGFCIAFSILLMNFCKKVPSLYKKVVTTSVMVIIISLGGLTYLRNNDWASSIKLWASAVNEDYHNCKALSKLGDAYLFQAANNKMLWKDAVKKKYYKTQLIINNPKADVYILSDAAGFYLEQGEIKKAESLLNRAEQIKPNLINVITNKAALLLVKGMPDDALKVLDKTKGMNLNLIERITVLRNYVEIYLSLNDKQKAIVTLKEILKYDPVNIEALGKLGDLYFKQFKLKKAEGYYRKVLQNKKDSAVTHLNLGVLYSSYGDIIHLNRAIEEYNLALKINPNYPDAHNNLGMAMIQLGGLFSGQSKEKAGEYYDNALKEFQIAVKEDPEYVQAWVNLARAYAVFKKDYLTADAILDVQLKKYPTSKLVLMIYASVMELQSKYNKAEEYYLMLINYDKNNYDAMWNLAKLYAEKLNNKKAAVIYLKRAYQCVDSNLMKNKILHYLNKIEAK